LEPALLRSLSSQPLAGALVSHISGLPGQPVVDQSLTDRIVIIISLSIKTVQSISWAQLKTWKNETMSWAKTWLHC